jgi:hypothetical protein
MAIPNQLIMNSLTGKGVEEIDVVEDILAVLVNPIIFADYECTSVEVLKTSNVAWRTCRRITRCNLQGP